jgi:hypothetical protein
MLHGSDGFVARRIRQQLHPLLFSSLEKHFERPVRRLVEDSGWKADVSLDFP